MCTCTQTRTKAHAVNLRCRLVSASDRTGCQGVIPQKKMPLNKNRPDQLAQRTRKTVTDPHSDFNLTLLNGNTDPTRARSRFSYVSLIMVDLVQQRSFSDPRC